MPHALRSISVLVVLLAACASPGGIPPTAPPDLGRRVVAEHGAVSSANPLASEAGVAMLQAGGNAVDAAVATAFAVGVVEPQMSGIGGSGAMTIWMQQEGRAEFLDFYAAQNADTYRAAFESGRIPTERSGPGDLRIVGIPGNVAGLLAAHERFGRLQRAQVLAPAIRLAEEGFPVNQVMAEFILSSSEKIARFEPSQRLLVPGGKALSPGQRFKNPELAAALRRVAEAGPAGFYQGETARRLVETLNAAGNPVTLADLAGYQVQWERPVCSEYRGRVLLSAPPPESGAQVLQTLKLLEPFDLPALGLPTHSARALDVLASALRVGIADNRGNGDPNWTPMSAAGRVSAGFARERSGLIGRGTVTSPVPPGDALRHEGDEPTPACAALRPYGPTPAIPGGASSGSPDPGSGGGETTHLSAVDGEGNAVALTQTNSSVFGSGASVAGFFLNDSGFQFTPETVRAPSLSRWRTRSTTIAPTVVLDGGRVEMVVGAPGGGLIQPTIVQAMVYVLDYGMDPLEAVRMPRLFSNPGSNEVQMETGFTAEALEGARTMGWEPTALSPGYARIYMILRRDGKWIAVADPRHNGEARGY
ncbi:MAG: gamma-glutamyltransferase family protein [Longimicrobiales bacterium]|nr:gamma-glutamyltransferase family protein [Longimicrobiales bacterium]